MSDSKALIDNYKPTHPDFDFRKYPFYWIALIDNIYAQRMEKTLKPLGLTIIGWRVGMLLRHHNSLSVSEISKHSAVKLSTVTKTVYSMQEKGLLKVQQSKQDARVTEVSITANGLALLEKVLLETADIFDRALNGIGEQEILQINALLERLFNNLSDTY